MRLRIHYLLLCLVAFCAPQIQAQAPTGLAAVRVVPQASPSPTPALSQPVFVTAPPNDFNRLFIVRQTGQIHILNLASGLVNATPFLDISAIIQSGGEQGLLGMAFDPNYNTVGSPGQGKFYLYFTVAGGAFGAGVTHVSQLHVSADPDVADATETVLQTTDATPVPLTFDHPQQNHNGGWIGFSPRSGDAYNLYVATGDGGNGDDQGLGHHEPGGNSQWLETLLGKMLRVHVDPAAATYSIPANNPYAGSSPPVRKEIWLSGLRNPFRDSFDRLNGRMFIGDVGQGTREEVDVQQPSNPGGGENYGWRDREGLIQNPAYPTPAPTPTPNPPWVDPILDYPRSTGATVIGGYVYRGSRIPNLVGTYVFGDYAFGKIFALNYDGNSASNFQDITSQLFPIPLPGGGTVSLVNPSSFGEDASGELYIADIGNNNIYKIVPALASVVSRKTHGKAATFDVDLPTTGSPGVECRSGGGSGNHTLVFTFSNPLSSVAEASVTGGMGSVSSRLINPGDARQYIVNLTSVSNAQVLTVSLIGVTDAASHDLGTFSVSMGLLAGDTNANRVVNSSDVAQTKSKLGSNVTGSNFREDVNVDGSLNSSDVGLVKSKLGTSLP